MNEPQSSLSAGLILVILLNMSLDNKKVLDMGCGTAVLAILSKLKRASYVEAIDIDEWAYNNSLENIRNNNCEGIVVKKGGADLLGDKSFDIVLANINRNILLNDMKSYAHCLNKGGDLLLSGFFKTDVDILIQEANKNKLTLTFTESKNDWTILHLMKE